MALPARIPDDDELQEPPKQGGEIVDFARAKRARELRLAQTRRAERTLKDASATISTDDAPTQDPTKPVIEAAAETKKGSLSMDLRPDGGALRNLRVEADIAGTPAKNAAPAEVETTQTPSVPASSATVVQPAAPKLSEARTPSAPSPSTPVQETNARMPVAPADTPEAFVVRDEIAKEDDEDDDEEKEEARRAKEAAAAAQPATGTKAQTDDRQEDPAAPQSVEQAKRKAANDEGIGAMGVAKTGYQGLKSGLGKDKFANSKMGRNDLTSGLGAMSDLAKAKKKAAKEAKKEGLPDEDTDRKEGDDAHLGSELTGAVGRGLKDGTIEGLTYGLAKGVGKDIKGDTKRAASNMGVDIKAPTAGKAAQYLRAAKLVTQAVRGGKMVAGQSKKQTLIDLVYVLTRIGTAKTIEANPEVAYPVALGILALFLQLIIFFVMTVVIIYTLSGSKGAVVPPTTQDAPQNEAPPPGTFRAGGARMAVTAQTGFAQSEPAMLLGLTTEVMLALNVCGETTPVVVTSGVGGSPGTARYDGRAVSIATKGIAKDEVAALQECLAREGGACVQELLGPDPARCVTTAPGACEDRRRAQVQRSNGEISYVLRSGCVTPASAALAESSATP